jgi:CheY-like chemotaxis protein
MNVVTLLIVDDVAENRDMLSRRLERRGYRTK